MLLGVSVFCWSFQRRSLRQYFSKYFHVLRSHPKYFKFVSYRYQTLLVYIQLGNVGFHSANYVCVCEVSPAGGNVSRLHAAIAVTRVKMIAVCGQEALTSPTRYSTNPRMIYRRTNRFPICCEIRK